MGSTRRAVAVAAGLLALYATVLVANGPATKPEVFPFFGWSLFSEVPDPVSTDYGIRLTSIDGRELAEPIYFERARDLLPRTSDPQAYQTIQALGRAYAADQPVRAAAAQERFERTYLRTLDAARYEVVRRRFDIVERHRCDCFRDEAVLAEGSTGP